MLEEGLRGAAPPKRPGLTGLGGRGVIVRQWSVLKEGVRGTAFPNGPGTPTWVDVEFCPGGGWCSRGGVQG